MQLKYLQEKDLKSLNNNSQQPGGFLFLHKLIKVAPPYKLQTNSYVTIVIITNIMT